MAERTVRIITKQTAVPGRIPTGTTGNELNFIKQGELAQNTADKKLYGFNGTSVFEYGSSSFLNLFGGTISGNTNVYGSLSANTIYSGGTNLYNIFSTTDTNDITRVQPGSNVTTGGTGNNPTVSVVANPSFNNITGSGTTTTNALSATTLSAGTLYVMSALTDNAATAILVRESNGEIRLRDASTIISSGGTSSVFTGGTVGGDTIFTAGVTANTISATTYYNLPNQNWTSGSSGTFSIKANNDSLLDATGNYSVAEGFKTQANGNYSHSEGAANNSIGECAHTEGNQTTAIGDFSHAEGQNTFANGLLSHVEGDSSQANGITSHAEGGETQANGDYSHSQGYRTLASGYASHAEGEGTIAGGFFGGDHAEGSYTNANGGASHAEGSSTQANGINSHAEGGGSIANGPTSHAEGTNTIAAGNSSHAEGYTTQAIGDNSHSEGFNSISSGFTSHAEGSYTQANGENSHAEGNQTKANNYSAHAEGVGSYANGQFSHAEGGTTQANGNGSHSEGNSTIADGENSHAGGYLTKANGANSFSHGNANISSGLNSAVIGGEGITGSTDNATYVPFLYVMSANTDNSASSILVREADGEVRTRDFSAFTIGDIYTTGATYSAGTATFRRNDGVTYSISGLYTGATEVDAYLNLSGGTVTGRTVFTSGLTASTIIVGVDVQNSLNPERLLVNDDGLGMTGFSNTIVGKANVNNYAQLNIQNINSGASASSDVVATADNGNESAKFVNMGINSSTFNGSVGFANDAYLYSTGNNLIIANATTGKTISFLTDGVASGNTRMSIASAGAYFTNVTTGNTTNQRQVRIWQDSSYMDFGSYTVDKTRPAIYMNVATPGSTNHILSSSSDGLQTYMNGFQSVTLSQGTTNKLTVTNVINSYINDTHTFSSLAKTSGAQTIFTITPGTNAGQTASTEIPNFKIANATKTWATGALPLQRWSYLQSQTAAFSGASTITDSYGLFVDAASAGTNATITNNYAAGFNGNVSITGSVSATTYINLPAFNSPYQNLRNGGGSLPAAAADSTYYLTIGGNSLSTCVSGTGNAFVPANIYIAAADYPTVNGKTPKLRVRATVMPNNQSFTGNTNFGLYPIGSNGGAVGAKVHTLGTVVTGSTVSSSTYSNLAYTVLTGSDFPLPTDGWYCVGFVKTGGISSPNGFIEFQADLQLHYS